MNILSSIARGWQKQDMDDLAGRRHFMGLLDDDCQSIRAIRDIVERELPNALDIFYAKVKETPSIRRFFSSDAHMQSAKKAQQDHWKNIAAANFGEEFAGKVNEIGRVHARIGLEPRWYIGGYAIVLEHLIQSVILSSPTKWRFWGQKSQEQEKLAKQVSSLCKAVLFEMDLTISVYLTEAEKTRNRVRDEAIHQEQDFVSQSFGAVIQAVAEGDLSRSMCGALPLPYMPLQNNMNAAIESLRDTLLTVTKTTQEIDCVAQEISNAAHELAQRTERQATSVENTASAIEQITATVSSTALRVSEASGLVETCHGITRRFAEMIERAIDTMQEIEKSSDSISNITVIMDAISAQTNILALNTAVEAARAGHAGNGFKVLAEQIRALANRAGEASKNVRGLTAQTQAQVARGASTMQEAGEEIGTIITGIAHVSRHLKAIDEAAREEAGALRDVNGAVVTIDQGTRQNAQMAEQTYTASSGMVRKAGQLRDVLNGFRLRASG